MSYRFEANKELEKGLLVLKPTKVTKLEKGKFFVEQKTYLVLL
jgi:hypothetical protein